jgi:Leucine-rich repeat (LRR) protein
LRLYSNQTATDLVLKLIFNRFQNLQILEFPFGIFENISTEHFPSNCNKLEKFLVTNGVFQAVPANCFANCVSLKELHLGGNAINSLVKDSFAGLASLSTLMLDDNQLLTIPSNVFDALPNLKILDISNNTNLRSFDDNVFKLNTNLNELIIAHNKFSTLKKEYFEGLTALNKLDATAAKVVQLNLLKKIIYKPL